MIVITLGPVQETPDDPLGRDRAGYKEGMSPLAIYDAARGTWHLGAKANRERYVLFGFKGQVKLAVEVNRIDPSPDGRSVITGDILEAGHPVYDKYVNKQSPIPPQRNPIGYFDAPEDQTPCLCGCDEPTPAGKDFVTGHDQTALHERVKKIGTVKEFMDWFDAMRKPFASGAA